MSIIVSCDCGKKFKAKDDMAGKKVRCPDCKSVIEIPGAGDGSAVAAAASAPSKKKSSGSKVNAESALLKYEAAQKQKQMSAEAEAAYKLEQQKLIASYDQLAGKGTDEKLKNKKKKDQLTEVGVKKPTVTTKAADAAGTVFGNVWVKYFIIAALVGGAAYGSALLVGMATGAIDQSMVSVNKSTNKQDRIKELYIEVRKAILAENYTLAKKKLAEVLEEDPSQIKSRNYTENQKRLDEASAGKSSKP
mgnify:CR=1 FL=1